MSEKLPMPELYAYVADDSEGEGVLAYPFKQAIMPLIGADMERMESLRKFAEAVAQARQKPVRLIRFTNREDLEVIAVGEQIQSRSERGKQKCELK